jgi:hypothetical protein
VQITPRCGTECTEIKLKKRVPSEQDHLVCDIGLGCMTRFETLYRRVNTKLD